MVPPQLAAVGRRHYCGTTSINLRIRDRLLAEMQSRRGEDNRQVSCRSDALRVDLDFVVKLPTYSQELGLDLRRPEDRFRWLVASVLFAKRISAGIAETTFKLLMKNRLDTPERIRGEYWERLVEVLDLGGYVRYDFSTATNLQTLSSQVLDTYGTLDNIHEEATDSRDLEKRLDELRGVGPTAISIFLRELRGIWQKADPEPSPVAKRLAASLGLSDARKYEAQLVRLYIEYCKKGRCDDCPAKDLCRSRKRVRT